LATLAGIRDRMLPMLELAADRYRGRVPEGYPNVVDTVDSGVIGLEIEPSYALYITSDGTGVWADIYRRNPRTDNRASASREKFGGMPFNDQRPLRADVSDQELRNLIAELMADFNWYPNLINTTDD
jgi:hypothetical protein